jgi:hypothetical protein
MGPVRGRIPLPSSLDPRRGRRPESLKIQGTDRIRVGREEVDLSAVEQIVSWAQLQAVGRGLLLARREYMDGTLTVSEILDRVEERVRRDGLDVLDAREVGSLAAFRRFELAASLNRVRTLKLGGTQGAGTRE